MKRVLKTVYLGLIVGLIYIPYNADAMIRALWTAASGMIAEQANIDVISNNLANVNTTGYKKGRVDFEDLIYQHHILAGAPAAEGSIVPTGISIGLGVRVGATQKIFSQGNLKRTENPFDIAIEGDGFFRILLPDGTEVYTRDGSFKLDGEGRIVTSEGHFLADDITIPEDATFVSIADDGRVSVLLAGANQTDEIGQLTMAKFVNPAGLIAIGSNLFKESTASGPPITGTPGAEGFGRVRQGFLEVANVQVVEEMVNLITSQRAYEFNSKAIQTSDQMLQTAVGLRR